MKYHLQVAFSDALLEQFAEECLFVLEASTRRMWQTVNARQQAFILTKHEDILKVFLSIKVKKDPVPGTGCCSPLFPVRILSGRFPYWMAFGVQLTAFCTTAPKLVTVQLLRLESFSKAYSRTA